MRLCDLISDAATVNALEPEELAVAMLGHMNWLVANDRAHANGRFHANNYCNGESKAYEESGKGKCAAALAEAFGHLIVAGMLTRDVNQSNDWQCLTRRARAIKTESDYDHFRKASLYPVGSVHPVIQQETHAEFLRGDYETAVFKAFKAIEVAVRPYANAAAHVVGRDLMVKGFHSETGTLRDPTEVPAERESLMELLRGAIGRFKNPTSHREVNFENAAEVVEILQLASLLLRIVDRRAAALPEHVRQLSPT